jgi:sucrose-6-phosphate hydrolase SacC (GH32 family)
MGIRNCLSISLLFLTTLLSTACGGGSSTQSTTPNPTANFSRLTSSCFAASATNPVITRGIPATAFAADWNDPSVIKVGNQYWMYASSDDNLDLNVKIFRLTSSDGLSWTLNPATPVLSADTTTGVWDHHAVETPSVVYFNGKYHMFYTGYPVSYTDTGSYKIGHATSTDGINWTRDANNPIVAPTAPTSAVNLDFNQFITAEPAAVVFNNKIYLYFSAVGANTGVMTTLQVIGLTTSGDGTTWSAAQSVLAPDLIQYPRPSVASGWLGYSTPTAAVLNGQVHLYFDVVEQVDATTTKQHRLHHASSIDGITGWAQDSTSIYSNTNFTWAADEIRSPSVLLDGTSLYMWFAGSTATPTLSIGQAKCAL